MTQSPRTQSPFPSRHSGADSDNSLEGVGSKPHAVSQQQVKRPTSQDHRDSMRAVREKRKSCEACRTRKLKCSGQDTGCSRCVHLGIVCRFYDKGLPGRPRKWSLNDAGEPQRYRPRQFDRQDKQVSAPDTQLSDCNASLQQDIETPPSYPTLSTLPSEGLSVINGNSTDLLSTVPQDWNPGGRDDMLFSYRELRPLPILDFNTSAQLDELPLDSFQACLSPALHNGQAADMSSSTSVTSTESTKYCNCSKHVFEIIRLLEQTPVSHSTVHALRQGIQLFGKLLTCPICYDVSKPPRITLQNVMLLGRLSLEVASGYHKYLEWVKDYCKGLAERKMGDMIYLKSNVDNSTLGFQISSDKLYELITDGLHSDVQRLSELGIQFATRQRSRHLIGHQACPDWDGRCWKEKLNEDPDASDVCPQSPAARTLTPCYRIVDEVRAKIKQLEDAMG
ncbi:hypothetical protein NM208_g394 [Fusarium decemcellulare]|uniref:Uncharacterized protein n=2 Tax=Fusarium decemcellulare TaxID=57161 RepID=A0ACC1SZW6_9HYPO|nr:hypothetical protein NM208_g3905 [Fusarium decemcellulare]KAJ3549654.1 hypothetical protein NM208_g394 [Fusarium decemcellulare]